MMNMCGLLILLCLFTESFAAIFSFAFEIELALLLRICCVLTFTYSIFLAVLTKDKPVSNKARICFWISLFIVSTIMLFMFIVDLFYDNQHPEFKGMMLSFGSKALVAPLLALSWNKYNFLDNVVKWIIPLTFVFTLVMLSAVKQLGGNSYLQLSIGYQTLSYAAAFSIGLLFYYLNVGGRLLSCGGVTALVLILLDLFVLFSSGGKGAFVLVCSLFVLNFYSRLGRKSVFLFACAVFLLVVGNNFIVSRLSLLSGGNRILSLFFSNNIEEVTSGRDDIYRRSIDLIFDRLFLAGGPGSVLYDVGYYAHNLFLDILIDWGFIGFLLSILAILYVVRNYTIFRNEKNMSFLFTIFLMNFVQLMFSGSFYANFGIWFSSIAILGYEKNESRRSIIQPKS